MQTIDIPRTKTIMREIERLMPDRSLIVARVGLHKLAGNAEAYWSATCEIYDAHGTWNGKARRDNGRDMDGGGAAHDEILRAFPKLAPIVAVHLSDPDGVPMHAVENGWYFYSGQASAYEREHYGAEYAARQGGEMERAARALHLPVGDLPEAMDREAFAAFAESLRPMWREQAEAAFAVLQSL